PAAEGGQQRAEVQGAGGRGREPAAHRGRSGARRLQRVGRGRSVGHGGLCAVILNSIPAGHTSWHCTTNPAGTVPMLKRVVLFLATTLAVLALLSIIMSVFGINPQSMGGLLVMAALFGFGGSLISLLSSKWVAKRAAGLHVIAQPKSDVERWLVDTVARQAQAAGIGMPEVAIYDAPEINAFATGANRNNALVAVSTGLLRSMDQDEAEAVLAHEVSHVANGDMVTMALLQGVLNTFVIVLARLVGRVIDGYLSGGRDNGGGGLAYFAIVFV